MTWLVYSHFRSLFAEIFSSLLSNIQNDSIMLTEGGMYVSGEVVHLPMVSLCSSKKKLKRLFVNKK